MKLEFLGTGGGRYVTGMQRRKTAGIVVETEETQVHVDPGPGAVVEANEQNVAEDTEAVIVSHGHLDHSNDAEAVIEMMTEAYDQEGAVFANETVLRGHGNIEKRVSDFHQESCGRVEKLEEGSETEFRDLEIRSQELFHSDPKTQGFVLETEEKSVGFWTDTEFSEELLDFYSGVDVMVVYCSRPKGENVPTHTSLDQIPGIVEEVEPNAVIVTHFGFKFLDSDMEQQEKWLKEQVDCRVIFAEDGMEFPGDAKLSRFAS
ncbi:MAG: MBL fold metallo-hydrolase [Candidatus Nanohaloarchaea archaeon]